MHDIRNLYYCTVCYARMHGLDTLKRHMQNHTISTTRRRYVNLLGG